MVCEDTNHGVDTGVVNYTLSIGIYSFTILLM